MASTRHLIIGGGPAGSYLAYLLAQRGEHVDLYERNVDQVRHPKACSGGVAKWWIKRTGVPLPEDVVAAHIDRGRILYGDEVLWETGGKGAELGYVLRRGAFERYLQDEAERLGARIIHRARYSVSGYDRVYLAEGAVGTVKRSLGLASPRPIDDFHMGVQIIGYGPEPDGGRTMEVYVEEEVTGGYAWRFPTMIPGTRDYAVEVGLGVPMRMGSRAWDILERWLERRGWNIRPVVRQAHIIPTSHPQRQKFGRVMVLGDDAYLTNPAAGGGIHAALLSALRAADWKSVPYRFRLQTRILYKAKSLGVKMSPSEVVKIIRTVGPSVTYSGDESPYRKAMNVIHMLRLLGLAIGVG